MASKEITTAVYSTFPANRCTLRREPIVKKKKGARNSDERGARAHI
jgi:hypothetical protein